jgi:hypothetical protein
MADWLGTDALEGGDDFRAALLKNLRAKHDEKPQGGQEGQGAQCCDHPLSSG